MQRRRLGPLEVSALGLGCMGMSEFYGPTDEAEGVATIHRALDLGIDLLDTADMYGPYTNEELVGRAIRDRRGRVQAEFVGDHGERSGIDDDLVAVGAHRRGDVDVQPGHPIANGELRDVPSDLADDAYLPEMRS